MTREFGRRLPPKFTQDDQHETTKSSFASVPLRRPLSNAIGQLVMSSVVPSQLADTANWVRWSVATPQSVLPTCCEYQ